MQLGSPPPFLAAGETGLLWLFTTVVCIYVRFLECAGIFGNFELEWNDFQAVAGRIMIISGCSCLLSFLLGVLSKDRFCLSEEKIEAERMMAECLRNCSQLRRQCG